MAIDYHTYSLRIDIIIIIVDLFCSVLLLSDNKIRIQKTELVWYFTTAFIVIVKREDVDEREREERRIEKRREKWQKRG